MRTRSKFLFILTLLFLVQACTEAPLYEKVYSFKDKTWNRSEKPVFKFDIKDPNKVYDFTLTLRTTTDYEFNNLWIFLKTETPEGVTAREPFQIPVTDESGAWIGNKIGSVVETQLNFNRRKLPQKGTYTFTVELGITESTVNEVLDLGFRVQEVKGN